MAVLGILLAAHDRDLTFLKAAAQALNTPLKVVSPCDFSVENMPIIVIKPRVIWPSSQQVAQEEILDIHCATDVSERPLVCPLDVT
jgi:hypothetical protein